MSGHKAPESHKRKSDTDSDPSSSTALVPTAPKRPKTKGPEFTGNNYAQKFAEAFASRACNPLHDALIADLIGMIWMYLDTARRFNIANNFTMPDSIGNTYTYDVDNRKVYAYLEEDETENEMGWFFYHDVATGRGRQLKYPVPSMRIVDTCPNHGIVVAIDTEHPEYGVLIERLPDLTDGFYVPVLDLSTDVCAHVDRKSGRIALYWPHQMEKWPQEHKLAVLEPFADNRYRVKVHPVTILSALEYTSVVIDGDYVYVSMGFGFSIYKIDGPADLAHTGIPYLFRVECFPQPFVGALMGFAKGCLFVLYDKEMKLIDAVTGDVVSTSNRGQNQVTRVDNKGRCCFFCYCEGVAEICELI